MENDGEGGDPPTAPSIGTTLLAGSCAGVLAQLLIYPFDVVRTRVQATGASVGACLRGALRPASRGGRPSVSGLYVGLSFPLAAQAVYKANVLTANELFSRATAPGSGGEARLPPAARAFLGGMLAGGYNAALFVTPVELVRNRVIARSGSAAGGRRATPREVLRRVWDGHGNGGRGGAAGALRRLYRGMAVTVARDALGCGAYFLAFDLGRRRLEPVLGGHAGTVLAGAGAGVGFWAVAMPFDTIKTRVQVGDGITARGVLRDALSRGDVAGLFRGWQVAVGRGAPGAAITLYSFELFKRIGEG